MFSLSLLGLLITVEAASFNFIVHGDWGWIGENQSLVADQMGRYADMLEARFVIALGDNFYVDGIKNITDPLWNTAFHDVYSADSLQVPWYPILGNHDYHVSVQAQIDRTYMHGEDLWTLPSNYYVYSYLLNDGGKMTIVYIDTQLLEPYHDDTQIIFDDPNWEEKRAEHLEWIDYTLEEEAKTATWLIVAGHYPIYSVGVNCDSVTLLKSLQPLLEKHKVHMYIAGHDHNHQWIEMNDGIVYVVSGQSGGRGPFGPEGVKCMGTSRSTNYIKNYFSECGFAYAEVDSTKLSVSFVNSKGLKKFTGAITNPFTPTSSAWGLLSSTSLKTSSGTATIVFVGTFVFVIAAAIVAWSHRSKLDGVLAAAAGSRDSAGVDDSTRSTAGLVGRR